MVDEEVREQAEQQETRQGRPPDIDEPEVFEACDAIRAAGTPPNRITGYAVRKHFRDAENPTGRGDPRRYERVIAKWRTDRRYDEPAARPRPSSAAEDVVARVEAAVNNAVAALQAIPAALREGVGRIDADAKAAVDAVRKEEAQARDKIVEELHQRDEEAAETVIASDGLVQQLREQIAAMTLAHAGEIERLTGQITERDGTIAGLIEKIEGTEGGSPGLRALADLAVEHARTIEHLTNQITERNQVIRDLRTEVDGTDEAPGLRARADLAVEHARTIERLRTEASDAIKARDGAFGERDLAKRDAQEYERRANAAETAYKALDGRLTTLAEQVARLTAPPAGDAVKAPRRRRGAAQQPEPH